MEAATGYSGCRFIEINSQGDLFTSIEQQVLRSTDGGENWYQIDDDETANGSKAWIGRGGSNLPGRYILLETGVPGRKFFCSGEHGLWESASLGDHPDPTAVAVTQIEGQVNDPNAATSTSIVAVHPNNPDILYTLQFRQDHRDDFRRSMDGGKTWSNISTPIDHHNNNLSNDRIFPFSLIIDPDEPDNIYFTVIRKAIQEVNGSVTAAGFDKFGVYKSADGGFTWNIVKNGLPANCSVRRLEMHPTKSNVIYAALNHSGSVNGALYKTTDRATNWSKVTIPTVIKSVNNVHLDETTNDIYISCGRRSGSDAEGGIWRSKDDGANWEKIFDLPYVWQTETSVLNPNIIVASVPWNTNRPNPGAYISRNGGKTWIKVNKNLAHASEITDIRPDNDNENVFWCAGWGSGWYKGVLNTTSVEETVAFNKQLSTIESTNSIPVTIDYTSGGDREVVAIINSPNGTWLMNKKVTVTAGSGTIQTTIDLAEDLPVADGYTLKISIRPIGGNGGDFIDSKEMLLNVIAPFNCPDTDVYNECFESGIYTWTGWGDATKEVSFDAPHTGLYSLKIAGLGASNHIVNGLIPNTSYELSVFMKVEGLIGVNVGVKEFNGSNDDLLMGNTNTSYEEKTIQFTTGSNATSAKVYVYSPNENGVAYVDDIAIKRLTITGADTVISSSITIYPNPTSGKVALNHDANWELYSPVGNLLGAGTNAEIDLTDLPQGIYIIKTDSGVERVVKQ